MQADEAPQALEDKPLVDLKTSPLAPEKFPVMPPISGVQLGTAEAGVRYAGRTDVLLTHLILARP